MTASSVAWRQILRTNFVDPVKLADFLELSETQRMGIVMRPRFALNVPRRLASKMAKGDLEDPLLKQFLPTQEENISAPQFLCDPVGDIAARKTQKLLHKYEGRVLLLCTSACAMHCRYCFRQHFDYEVVEKLFVEELKMIENDASIQEVILSGGDPLSLDDRVLEDLLLRLSKIPHVRKVRFHTRFPVGVPERIDQAFVDLLSRIPLQFWFVIHSNHPREMDADVLKALKSLQCIGIPILNQFVLLKGINDDVDVLFELCTLLVDNGIMPYYLHQLDRVQGTAHFEVSKEKGKALIAILAAKLPGYALPKYVEEIAGMPNKTYIA